MRLKFLYIATSDIHLATFHKPYLKWLSKQNIQVDIAVEKRGGETFDGVSHCFYLKFPRSISPLALLSTYKKLKCIINSSSYDIIHCHTPIPSFLARLAARTARKKGTIVLYTAHGFHFYNGAPIKKWLIYFTTEYILSSFTDAIITMNTEDYRISRKLFHKNTHIIPGMGVDPNRYKAIPELDKLALRQKYGIDPQKIIVIYIAEFIQRKNHKLIIDSIKASIEKFPKLEILFAGKGELKSPLEEFCKQQGLSIFKFLGFRKDISELIQISDIGISSSIHEGLPIGILQEMFSSLPIIASVERGHKELIEHERNGYLFPLDRPEEFILYLNKLYRNSSLRETMGRESFKKAQNYSIDNSLNSMIKIYNQYLSNHRIPLQNSIMHEAKNI